MGKYLSCGEYNKNYKYIILSVIFSFITTALFGYGHCIEGKEIYFGKIYSEDIQSIQEDLSHHIIIHNIYRNIVVLIISLILFKYEQKDSESKINNTKTIKSINNRSNTEIELIYEENIVNVKSESNLFIYFIIFLFIIQDILTNLYFNFDLKEINLWIFELPLLSYFNYILLNIKIYGHHKFAMYLSSIIPLIVKIITLFIHIFSEDFNHLIYNKYKALFFAGIIPFIIIITIRSYTLTKIKIFIDLKYISSNRILMNIGIVGILINFIIMLIFTFIKCGTINDIDIHLCNVDENNNRNESYIENFIIYFKTLNNAKYYNSIIEFFTSLIGSLTYFCFIYFYILIIKYLSSVHTIIYALTNSFAIQIISMIIKFINNSYFSQTSFDTLIFIITTISDICSVVGILIYCEIIELNFCRYNYFLRRNIIKRGEVESKKFKKNGAFGDIIEEEKDVDTEESNPRSMYYELKEKY